MVNSFYSLPKAFIHRKDLSCPLEANPRGGEGELVPQGLARELLWSATVQKRPCDSGPGLRPGKVAV